MDNNKTNRRDFFKRAAQLTFFSALVGGSAYMFSQNRVQLDGCAENKFCKSCQTLNTCSHDQAKNFRKDER